MKNISFIGGTGRSGTTLLARIFAAHPDVCEWPESRFLVDPDGILDFYDWCCNCNWSPYSFDRRIKRLKYLLDKVSTESLPEKVYTKVLKSHWLPFHKIWPNKSLPYAGLNMSKFCPRFHEISNEFINKLCAFSYEGKWMGMNAFEKAIIHYAPPYNKEQCKQLIVAFINQLAENACASQNKQFLVEKNTWNILFFDKILELFSDSKLVHIYRDPRDVVASFKHQTWMPSNAEQCALVYKELMAHWRRVESKVPAERYFMVSLEELVAKPGHVLEQICSFLDIPFSSEMLNMDFSKSHAGRWRKDLDAMEIKKVHAILQFDISDLGYESLR